MSMTVRRQIERSLLRFHSRISPQGAIETTRSILLRCSSIDDDEDLHCRTSDGFDVESLPLSVFIGREGPIGPINSDNLRTAEGYWIGDLLSEPPQEIICFGTLAYEPPSAEHRRPAQLFARLRLDEQLFDDFWTCIHAGNTTEAISMQVTGRALSNSSPGEVSLDEWEWSISKDTFCDLFVCELDISFGPVREAAAV